MIETHVHRHTYITCETDLFEIAGYFFLFFKLTDVMYIYAFPMQTWVTVKLTTVMKNWNQSSLLSSLPESSQLTQETLSCILETSVMLKDLVLQWVATTSAINRIPV